MKNSEDLFPKIREWAEERGIYLKGDMKTQCLKLQEEVGELSKGILKNNPKEITDAIGDCVVVLTNLAELASIHFEEDLPIEVCLEHAWNEIKDRKGKMSNGTFEKDN